MFLFLGFAPEIRCRTLRCSGSCHDDFTPLSCRISNGNYQGLVFTLGYPYKPRKRPSFNFDLERELGLDLTSGLIILRPSWKSLTRLRQRISRLQPSKHVRGCL